MKFLVVALALFTSMSVFALDLGNNINKRDIILTETISYNMMKETYPQFEARLKIRIADIKRNFEFLRIEADLRTLENCGKKKEGTSLYRSQYNPCAIKVYFKKL
jgi:hypothetical protein